MGAAWALLALAGVGLVGWVTASSVINYRKYKAFDKLSGNVIPKLPEGRVVYVSDRYWDSAAERLIAEEDRDWRGRSKIAADDSVWAANDKEY